MSTRLGYLHTLDTIIVIIIIIIIIIIWDSPQYQEASQEFSGLLELEDSFVIREVQTLHSLLAGASSGLMLNMVRETAEAWTQTMELFHC